MQRSDAMLHILPGSSRARRLAAVLALVAGMAAAEAHALPSPLTLQAGVEYSQGGNDQNTRSALAMATLGAAGLSVSAGILRFDDNQIGAGNGFIAGVGVPLLPLTSLRVQGVRFIGDDTFRAWRVKAGPVVSLPLGPTLGVSYVRHEDNGGGRSNGVAGELGIPIPGPFSAQANASYASLSNGLEATAGAIGLGWRPIPLLEFTGEIGLARNGSLMTSTSTPPGRTIDLPVLGDVGPGGSSGTAGTREESRTETTFLFGVQTRFP